MKIVIDIDKEDWKDINDIHFIREDLKFKIGKAIMKGTPLPKGHGRLIDADELEELFAKMCTGDCGACDSKRKTDGRGRWYDTCSLIDVAPTIIEGSDSE